MRVMLDQHARLALVIRATAESLWDISETILSTGQVCEGDWEMARAAASHMLVAIRYPETPAPKTAPASPPEPPAAQQNAPGALFPDSQIPKAPQKDVG